MPHREKAVPHVGAHSQHPEVSGKAVGYKERDGSTITSNGDTARVLYACNSACLSTKCLQLILFNCITKLTKQSLRDCRSKLSIR